MTYFYQYYIIEANKQKHGQLTKTSANKKVEKT